MDLHAKLKSVVEERLALAKAATPGPWRIDAAPDGSWYIDPGPARDDVGEAALREDAEFIAAHDPADALRRHEAALRSVEVHQPFPHRTGPRCIHCQDGTEPWPCGEFEIVAGAYGVEVD